MSFHIESISARPLEVPLAEPFTIASGRMDATRAALVEVTLVDEASGRRATGLGEAAALPPVTHEDMPDVLDAVRALSARLSGTRIESGDPSLRAMSIARGHRETRERPVAASGVEVATLDAIARLRGVALYALLGDASGGSFATRMVSDITIPIHEPSHMGELAEAWASRGFACFKVKVGIDPARDLAGLRAIVARAPGATLRIDANGGYDARTAIELYERATKEGAVIECFEQPCARDDLDGMAAVTRALPVPVVADESVRGVEDLARVLDRGAASGVNLKLSKMGVAQALEIGRRAKARGLAVMMGAMVETRLGITAAAHVCAALGGVRFVDLDTAWLLREDPFVGGYQSEGPVITLGGAPGMAIEYAGA